MEQSSVRVSLSSSLLLLLLLHTHNGFFSVLIKDTRLKSTKPKEKTNEGFTDRSRPSRFKGRLRCENGLGWMTSERALSCKHPQKTNIYRLDKKGINLLCPARSEAGVPCAAAAAAATGTVWWRLFPWEWWLWRGASSAAPDSDPATKPRATAPTHRASRPARDGWRRWLRFGPLHSSPPVLEGATCVHQHPNIFPKSGPPGTRLPIEVGLQ